MRIVVLDGYTLNPGDLSWDEFKNLGECQIFDRTAEEEIVERCRQAEIVITNKTPLTKKTISELPEVKYIGVIATGYNVVDVEAAAERDIPVTNIPIYGTKSVAQMTLALLLELTQHVGHHSQTVAQGRWEKSADFCYWDYPLIELDGLTMGIIGFGRIGQAVGNLANAFGMKVLAHDVTPPDNIPHWTEMTDLETVLYRSDVISLHCPLTPENTGFINTQLIESMKESVLILNTSRGPLINEEDLAQALNKGRVMGAGLDVLSIEPPKSDNPLVKAKNCIVTPHIAWATKAARIRLMQTAIDNLKSFLEEKPQNVVNR